jgi:hypothetical protein
MSDTGNGPAAEFAVDSFFALARNEGLESTVNGDKKQ